MGRLPNGSLSFFVLGKKPGVLAASNSFSIIVKFPNQQFCNIKQAEAYYIRKLRIGEKK